MEDLISKDCARMQSFNEAIQRLNAIADAILRRHIPSFLNERYLTDQELSKKLRISRRALQDYRNQGLIPYYQINNKNVLYKESDIERILQDGYRSSFGY